MSSTKVVITMSSHICVHSRALMIHEQFDLRVSLAGCCCPSWLRAKRAPRDSGFFSNCEEGCNITLPIDLF
jgi:hypothetical protein